MDPAAPLPAAELRCSQCGSELHPDEGQLFVTCPSCASAVYIDKARVVFHWALAPTLDPAQARAQLAQWMAGNQTVKDLDKKAQLLGESFQYFPLWFFKHRGPDGRELLALQPAAATAVTELKALKLPAGDLRKYDPALDSQAAAPTVPLAAALAWAARDGLAAGAVLESALVHVPVYTFRYSYQDQTYTALVEAGTGRVLANLFPAKAEAPYRLAGCLTAATFIGLALIPLAGGLMADANGFGIGLGVCAGLGLLAAPALFAFAAWVAARV